MVVSTPMLGMVLTGAHGGFGFAPMTLSCCWLVRSFFTPSCVAASGTAIPNFGAVVAVQAALFCDSGIAPSSEGGIQLFPSMSKEFPAKETFVLVPTEVIPPGGQGRRARVQTMSSH